MKRSNYFIKTYFDDPVDEVSKNAKLLHRAGFTNRLMSGVYSFLPLGVKVLCKIENIVRKEMNNLGAQECLLPALQPRQIWDRTNRWEEMDDILFKFKGAGDRELTLGPTHEEVVTSVIADIIQSHKDLPVLMYQIQTKFRNETRAKSGILRGREFKMKDLYSFHSSQDELDKFYKKVVVAYKNIFDEIGIGKSTFLTVADGGAFSKVSHEFQTVTPAGEDKIYKDENSGIAINEEIIDNEEVLKEFIPHYKIGDNKKYKSVNATEVGNIFKLSTKFSEPLKGTFKAEDGQEKNVIMGCYGIGISRLMGTVVECLADKKGLNWPLNIAPFHIYLIGINADDTTKEIYNNLISNGIEVLLDDRTVSIGNKLNEAELLGLPFRVVVSEKTLARGKSFVEVQTRDDMKIEIIEVNTLIKNIKNKLTNDEGDRYEL